MSASSLALFVSVFFVACASPGPAVTTLVARVLGNGTSGVVMLCLGLVLGEVFWLTVAAVGAAAVVERAHMLLSLIKYFGAAYLLFIAWRMWSAEALATAAGSLPERGGARMFLGGLILSLGNPKTMLFYLALLPGLLPLAKLRLVDLVTIALIVSFLFAAVLGAYTLAAKQARHFFSTPSQLRAVNRIGASLMAGAALLIAIR